MALTVTCVCLQIVPLSVLSHVKPNELEWIIAGTPFIDVEDWKKNTNYTGGGLLLESLHVLADSDSSSVVYVLM